MRQQVFTLFCFCLFTVTSIAKAESQPPQTNAENKMTLEDAADKKNKVDGDIDEEITNPKLRADSGSKSKWSDSTHPEAPEIRSWRMPYALEISIFSVTFDMLSPSGVFIILIEWLSDLFGFTDTTS